MKLPKIVWIDSQKPFKKIPLYFILLIAILISFNVFINLGIKNANEDIQEITKKAENPQRKVPAKFTVRESLGDKKCPNLKAGNPDAPLKFRLYESQTCLYCIEQDKVLFEILQDYGDLFYVEWYQVEVCTDEAKKDKISGVPTFIFNERGDEKEPAYGFLYKKQLIDYICSVSGVC